MRDCKTFNYLRVREGEHATTDEAGCNGVFILGNRTDTSFSLIVTISQRYGWEHVCVTKQVRSRLIGRPKQAEPSTADMQTAKQVFFKPEETCVEFFPHGPSSLHPAPNFRHLWRHSTRDFPMPESKRKLNADEVQERNRIQEN